MNTGGDLLVIELGALVLVLAVVARLARRIGLPALPLYLLAGLALGEGSLFELDASEDFIEVGAEIGVILMLLMLGLEFSTHELINNVRRSTLAGAVDLVLNFTPGFVAGLILGFDPVVAVLLGGVTYISSSGIVAKLVADLGRIGNHETSVILSVLVIEDLAMVLYLPIVSGVLFGGSALDTTITVAISLAAVLGVLGVAYLLGDRLSAIALSQSSEALLLTLLGGTLLVAGLAGRLGVSTAGRGLRGRRGAVGRHRLACPRPAAAAAQPVRRGLLRVLRAQSRPQPHTRRGRRRARDRSGDRRHQDRHRLDLRRTGRHRQARPAAGRGGPDRPRRVLDRHRRARCRPKKATWARWPPPTSSSSPS